MHYLKVYLGFFLLTIISVVADYSLRQSQLQDHEIGFDVVHARPLSSFKNFRTPASNTEEDVVIEQGEIAYLDTSMNINSLTIHGQLHCNENSAQAVIELKVRSIMIHGTFQCGTSLRPYRKKLIISLKHDDQINPKEDDRYRGLIVHGGVLSLNGDISKAGWTHLAQTAYPGDQVISIRPKTTFNPPIPGAGKSFKMLIPGPSDQKFRQWEVGDKIAIGPTGFNYLEAESFTITAVEQGNTLRLHLDKPLSYMHWGEKNIYQTRSKGEVVLDESAEVVNLTRQIVIRTDEEDFPVDEGDGPSAQLGGHVMVHHGGKAYVDGIEFYKMGQAGLIMRYPFHWHYVGEAHGQYVKNSSVHHSFQRCIVVHQTHKTTLYNNVCFNFKGHGYFLEDGNERENKIIKNLAILARAPSQGKALLHSDDIKNSEGQGRFPAVSAFWISNPNNYITHNVASGSVGTGFWMSFEKEVKRSSGKIIATPIITATDTFNYNTAHSTRTGITWDGAPGNTKTNNPNNPNDRFLDMAHYAPPFIPIFKGLVAYKNILTGIYFRGQTAIFDQALVADNGWSIWMAYNQIIQNSVIIGETQNKNPQMDDFYFQTTRSDRYRKTGVVMYDGPFEVHQTEFLDFSTQAEFYNLYGNEINATMVPFTATGGTNKFINVVSGLSFEPEPIHRMHVLGELDNLNTRHLLTANAIRDLDGSLTNEGPGVITAKWSVGVLPRHNCSSGGESFKNFLICPESYTESVFYFMRWDSPYVSPWATPFIVLRSDGVTNFPHEIWSNVYYRPHNAAAVTNSDKSVMEVLPFYQFEKDRSLNVRARVELSTEKLNPKLPIFKIVAYGNNCKLEGKDAQKVSGIMDLYSANVTSYFSKDEEFFIKLVPKSSWEMITEDPRVRATALATNFRYDIDCDRGYLKKKVVGKIDKVSFDKKFTTISGWACNFTHNQAINVQLYAGSSRNFISKLSRGSQLTLISQMLSDTKPDTKVSVACGLFNAAGRRFEFKIENKNLDKFKGQHFYVKGLSKTSEKDIFIENSGKFSVSPVKTNSLLKTQDSFK